MRKTISGLHLEPQIQQGQRGLLNGKSAPRFDQAECILTSERPLSRRTGRLDIKFLKDLYGQGEIAVMNQLLRAPSLRLLGRLGADRIDQDIGVDKGSQGSRS